MPTKGKRNWRRVIAIGIVSIFLVLHFGIVYSILSSPRPVIWPLHNDTIHRVGPGSDFFAVYHGSVNLQQGISPYLDNSDGITPYFYSFRYLPIVAKIFTFALLLSPEAAFHLWIVILEAIVLLLILAFVRAIPGDRLRVFAICILLSNSPYFLELYMGQFTFASASLVTLGFLVPYGALPYTAGVLLKAFPVAALPALIRDRKYMLHAIVAIGCVLILSAPYFYAHPVDWQAFYQSNAYPAGGYHSGNYGFVYFLYRVATDFNISALTANWRIFATGFRLMVLISTAVFVLLTKDLKPALGAVALLLAHFTTFPDVWEHQISGIIVVCLLLLTIQYEEKWAWPFIASALVVLSLPTPFALFDSAKDPQVWDPGTGWPTYASYLVLLPKVVPTVALYAFCMRCLVRSGLISISDVRILGQTRLARIPWGFSSTHRAK